ncbi:unnamed protein product, partial [Pleuronectes platessa]
PAGCPASLLQSFEGLADPASFSIQPTTGATRCPAGELPPLSEHTARQNRECRTLRPPTQETSQNCNWTATSFPLSLGL